MSDHGVLDLVAAAGVPADRVASVERLTGGTFNTVHRVRLHDGTGLVVKQAPDPRTQLMTYEEGILTAEAQFDALAGGQGLAVPEIRHATADALVMSECPGAPWFDHGRGGGWRAMRAELGGQVARAHRITGPGFGYPGGAFGPLRPTWPEAFLQMVGGVLSDAARFGATLPWPIKDIQEAYARQTPVLATVTEPALVHFDLWDGNILVDHSGGAPRLSALIDAERSFWGDPLADLVSTALLGDIEDDPSFLDGYRAAGGVVEFGPETRRRLALYRGYLDLIMLVEAVPRRSSDDHLRWLAQDVRPHLIAVLDSLR